ncbi:hypothetical protein [Dysgonomonas sp. 520]|uniref:hypothetical protein n=1 Tax=Dysgonomonas sp. 520 TaxID=2302931 RepID=UPI0013D10F94|nr:hypothetical protein [Dysgonomonas sp. 520]NDW09744.1 hypothetical protein [Dysgonomonas sp. 520]
MKRNVFIIYFLLSCFSFHFANAQNHPGGVIPATKAEYDSYPKVDEGYSTKAANFDPDDDNIDPGGSPGGSETSTTHYLVNPLPIPGDQGNMGSCVGWATSAAVSIMAN